MRYWSNLAIRHAASVRGQPHCHRQSGKLHYQTMIGWTLPYDPAFSYFKAKFPGSAYRSTIEQARALNASKFAAFSGVPPPAAAVKGRYYDGWVPQLIDEYGQLEDLRFEGDARLRQGSYYIDIWATWCRPCLTEMAYNYEADSLLAANDIHRMYISLDKLEDRAKWRDKIYELHLGGAHILAGETMRRHLSEVLSQDPIVLPRYLLLKDGQIVEQFAAGPSALERLKGQVDKLVGR